MNDYIPRNDAEFNIWQLNLLLIVTANVTLWGILQGDLDLLKAKQALWIPAFEKASNKQNRTSADVQAKNDYREVFEEALRVFISQWLSNNTKVTDSDREMMGLTVRKTTHTPVPVPSTIPLATVDFSMRYQHTLNFTDESSPRSKAKPKGVQGCEIWRKVGDALEFSYVALCTSTPYTMEYDENSVGKSVSYRLRWINTRGQQGPWSSTVSALIAG